MKQNDNDKDKKRDGRLNKFKDWQVEQAKAYRTYIKTSAVGLEFGLSIVIGALLGYFFDRHYLSSPYGLLVGVVIGSIAAVKRLLVFIKSYLKKNGSDDE